MFIIRSAIQLLFTAVFAVQSLVSLLPYTPPVDKRDMATPPAAVSEGRVLTEDYVIVRGAECGENEAEAAETLQKYLEQINGVTYEIVTDDAAPVSREIVVGRTNREGVGYTVDRSDLGKDGVYLKTVGEKLIISGAEEFGTLYGVYEFLKMYLDCRWYTADLTVIPKASEIIIPADINYIYVPDFYYRSTYFVNCSDREFRLANHLNGSDGFSIGSTLFTFAPPREYFEAHPEYYSLIDGERKPQQLCMTNTEVLNVVIENIQKALDANPSAGRVQVYPEAFETCAACQCEPCLAANATEDGNANGSYIPFLNKIAEHFEEKCPDVKFVTLAYAETGSPPKNVRAHDNVAVEYAVTGACYAHMLDDEDCKRNREEREMVEGWSKAANSIEIYDYIADYGHYVGIYPIFHVLQPHLQYYRDNNVVGMFGLGNGYPDSIGGFDNLMGYLLSNLYWNPDADCNRLMVEFCKAYFGDAAQNILQYLDIACYRAENSKSLLWSHITMSEDMHDGAIASLTTRDRKYINALWEEAKSFDLTDAQRRNVLHAEICWRYWKASNHVDEFSFRDIDAKKAAAQQLLDDMKAMGINRVCEGEPGRQFSDNPNLIRAPFYWQARWDGDWRILRLL